MDYPTEACSGGVEEKISRIHAPVAQQARFSKKRSQGHAASNRPKSSASRRPESASRPTDQRSKKGIGPATGSAPLVSSESWPASSKQAYGRPQSSRQTERQLDSEPTTSRSDTCPSERLYPRYGSKMPVSPRRARSIYGQPTEPQSRADKFSPALENVQANESTKVAKLNHHVASTVGAAVPKSEVWQEQLPGVPGGGNRTLVKSQTSAKAGYAETGQRKWIGTSQAAPKVLKSAAPNSKVDSGGNVKPSRRSTKSMGMNMSRKGAKAPSGPGKNAAATLEPHGRVLTAENTVGQSNCEGIGIDCDSPRGSRAPSLESFPSPPYIVGKGMLSDASSSDSDECPPYVLPKGMPSDRSFGSTEGHHSGVLPSPKVVRATGHSSSERETPRSGLPRALHIKPQMTSGWNLNTPGSDRSQHQLYNRNHRDGAKTSMEQEVADAPQNTPFSPTVRDAFNMHFASREDQNWLVDENRPQLGFETEAMNYSFPFSYPRRSSNPGSEISGVSELSRYQHRHNESDSQNGPKSLGLGRFGGHMFQSLGQGGWDGGQSISRGMIGITPEPQERDPKSNKQAQRVGTLSRKVDSSFSDASVDVSDQKRCGIRGNCHQRNAPILLNQQVLVQQDILQSPKGRSPGTSPKDAGKAVLHEYRMNVQSGSQYIMQGSDDGSTMTHSSKSVPYRPAGQGFHMFPSTHNGYTRQAYEITDDDRSIHDSQCRHSWASGECRTSLGGRILRVAVMAAAGVAAVVFGGELLKKGAIVDNDGDDDECR